MKHLFGTASAAGIAFGLALMATSAYAQQSSATGDGKSGDASTATRNSNNSNSQNTSYTIPVSNSLNDNSTNNRDSYNSTSVPINDSGNDQSTRNSENDNSKNSHNDNSQNYNVPITDAGNSYRDHHDNNSTNDSDNTSLKVGDVSLAMSSTDLKGSVSGQSFDARRTGTGLDSGQLTFSGNAMQGYSGITNANYVTGQGSLGQAANTVTATSSVSFR